MEQKTKWLSLIFDNGSYKLVALFVTVILWVTILGRRDFTLTKDFDVSIAVPAPYAVLEQSEKIVQVKVSGSRIALKKFASQPNTLDIELLQAQDGYRNVPIPIESLDLPLGVKLLAITPAKVQIHVGRTESTTSGGKDSH